MGDWRLKMTPLRERRMARRLFMAAALVSLLCISVRAQQTEPGTLSDAIRFFGHEKSAAEQYGVIFLTVAKDNTGLYVRGIKLYADAKAEFDGLIAELRFDLQSGQDPARSAKFNEALKEAAEKRIAFTSFVSAEVDKLAGARPGLPDVIQAVPELVKAITDAGQGDHRRWDLNLECLPSGPQGKPRCDTERAGASGMAVFRRPGEAVTALGRRTGEKRGDLSVPNAEGLAGARRDALCRRGGTCSRRRPGTPDRADPADRDGKARRYDQPYRHGC